MNLIKALEDRLNQANAMADNYAVILKDDPDNQAYNLAFKTAKNHIEELQTQMRREKEIREKEIFGLRLKGPNADYGTIPLNVLGALADNIFDIILGAAQFVKEGPKQAGQFSRELVNTVNLRFAGIEAGSVKIYITGDSSPNLFGESLLEDTLTKSFSLLTAATPTEFIESVSAIGIRSVRGVSRFLNTLTSNDLTVDLSWTSPSDKRYEWNGTKDVILNISETLRSIQISQPVILTVVGEVVMISKKGQIEVLDKDEVAYKCLYPLDMLDTIKSFHIGEFVKAQIKKDVFINKVTKQEKPILNITNIKSLKDRQ
jgi:hypothetical protein